MKRHPQLLEINAFFFLSRMSEKYGRKLTLATIPDSEWRNFSKQGFDYLWLMGVWERSPWSRAHAIKEPGLRHAYELILGRWSEEDVAGSPYAVHDYELDPFLGGAGELLQLKMKLNGMGMGLVLDFVPNHLAVDHPWVVNFPERFVTAKPSTVREHPEWFFNNPIGRKIAHGRDPYFPPWCDTAQVNFWAEPLRHAWMEILLKISKVADGVRCDMAMLGLNDVFDKVWGAHIETSRPSAEFWGLAISRVKTQHPGFVFIGEVYWDMDWLLQQQGFDFTYDKRLYDRMKHDAPESVNAHLDAHPDYRDKCLRFIENHDEDRAPVIFGRKKSQAAAVITSTSPGLRFFNDGQCEGRRIRTPIHLVRESKEPADLEAVGFYQRLLEFIRGTVSHEGEWRLLKSDKAWEKNESYRGLLAWLWHLEDRWKLVILNYSMIRAQGIIFLPNTLNQQIFIQFKEALTGQVYERTGSELARRGLYVDLEPWQSHLFDFTA